MGKRDDQRKVRLYVLNQIKIHKDILFGKCSTNLRRQMKADKWKEMSEYAKSLGAVDLSRDGPYLRDVWRPNARKSTLDKADNVNKPAPEGEKVLSQINREVLSIIGEDSPLVHGSDSPVSMDSFFEYNQTSENGPDKEMSYADCHNSTSNSNPATVTDPGSAHKSVFCAGRSSNMLDEISLLKKQCLKAQLYKLRLEARKLEIELGIPTSEIT